MNTLNRPNSSKPDASADTSRSSPRGATVGIEIGHNKIYMVRLRKGSDAVAVIDDCRTFEFDPKLGLRSASFTSLLRTALKSFCGSTRGLNIWAAPKQDRARLHHLQIPRVKPSRLPGAVYWAIQREERFLEKETVIDFQVEEGGDVNASSKLEITGVLAERGDIEDIQQVFSDAGYPLAGIGLPLFALRNLVNLRTDEIQHTPVLICQLGQHATSVSVLLERRLVFTRNIPLGLNNLAETLVKELDPTLDPEEAGNLILKLGEENEKLSPDERQQQARAFNLLRPTLERTARQIDRTLQYFQSNFNAEPIETIFIGGEITGRGYLFDFFSEQLSTNVIAIDPFETPKLRANTSLPEANADRIAYGAAFGLALEGGQAGTNLAYTYQDRQLERKHRRIATVVSIFLILLTAATGLFYSGQRSELNTLHNERDNLDQTLKSLGPPLSEAVIKEEAEAVRVLQGRRKAAAERYEGLALLSEITRLTPENISLLKVSTVMSGFIESLKKDEYPLVLEGVVDGERTSLETSLTIYIARLDQSHLFHSVEVDSTNLVENSDELKLTFTLKLKTLEASKGAVAKK